jgi:hypothetical protein
VVARLLEPSCEAIHHSFCAAVSDRGHGEPGRGEQPDAQPVPRSRRSMGFVRREPDAPNAWLTEDRTRV